MHLCPDCEIDVTHEVINDFAQVTGMGLEEAHRHVQTVLSKWCQNQSSWLKRWKKGERRRDHYR